MKNDVVSMKDPGTCRRSNCLTFLFSSGSVKRSCPKCPFHQRVLCGHPGSEDLGHVQQLSEMV